MTASGHVEAGLPHAPCLLSGTSSSGLLRCPFPGGLCSQLRRTGRAGGGGAPPASSEGACGLSCWLTRAEVLGSLGVSCVRRDRVCVRWGADHSHSAQGVMQRVTAWVKMGCSAPSLLQVTPLEPQCCRVTRGSGGSSPARCPHWHYCLLKAGVSEKPQGLPPAGAKVSCGPRSENSDPALPWEASPSFQQRLSALCPA